jgi:AraC-like DNA-binding protein
MKNNTYYPKETFNDYNSMQESSKIWGQVCTYVMAYNGYQGEHEFLYLSNILLSHTYRSGALYYDVISPPESISIAIINKGEGKACFGDFKLQEGDILFFDSIQNFLVNAVIEVDVISIPKIYLRKLNLYNQFNSYLRKKIVDTESLLSKRVNEAFQVFRDNKNDSKNFDYTKTEENIMEILLTLCNEQTPKKENFTPGESVVLQIIHDLYKYLNNNINITHLTTTYDIKERTLQKSFQSLIGFSPSYFLRGLKLNYIYKELKEATPNSTTVVQVAKKWGFSNMGRMSAYYRELFGENPSITLSRKPIQNTSLEDFCAIIENEI